LLELAQPSNHHSPANVQVRGVPKIYRAEFGGEPLDLVVDDASHQYRESRETFRYFIPLLRPGGPYVIEDWGWAHWPGENWQKNSGGDYFRDKPPLSNLLIELMPLCASTMAGVVRRVAFNPVAIYVERGGAALEPGFTPEGHFTNRGKAAPQFG
jgi:hypothetical protein